jgi:hypothetical protein
MANTLNKIRTFLKDFHRSSQYWISWKSVQWALCWYKRSEKQMDMKKLIGAFCDYVKVKCTLVQALRLCTGRMAHERSRGVALPFLDHSTKRGWEVSVTPWPLFTPGKDPVPTVPGWAPGLVWTGAENLAPTGIRSPDCPARSQLLYRIRYPAHCDYTNMPKKGTT